VLVSALYVYPIKSCGGVALPSASVADRGFAYDRRFMLVDRTGTFVTQRELPRLALTTVRFSSGERELVVSAPHMPALTLEATPTTGVPTAVSVWGYQAQARAQADGSRWFSDFLGDEVCLVYMPEDEHRPVNPERARPSDIVSFADGYPFLLTSDTSLADLNARLSKPITMSRFRPNIVVAGFAPYAEDHFDELSIGAVPFRAPKRCDRCSVTTVDPQTGARGKEPLRTLARYRLAEGKVWFGMNLIHDASGVLNVGDPVVLRGGARAEP
jgi:uncharacterized protein YcbX